MRSVMWTAKNDEGQLRWRRGRQREPVKADEAHSGAWYTVTRAHPGEALTSTIRLGYI